ncbi:MAG: SDR family oxidoreductase [Candidatus Sulfotelmatobacter sp.]|jgi:NAD(P)-dependent dehydrogenase (short-subunit alcohol dehydrogenase family)
MSKSESDRVRQLFDLSGRVAIITGGAGLLGYHHGAILAAAGAHVVLLDLPATEPASRAVQIAAAHRVECLGLTTDITNEASVSDASGQVMAKFGRIDILVNNAANNPKVEESNGLTWSRLENLPLDVWEADIRVGLTGAFLCSRVFGAEMAKRKAGVIVNVASDLAVIAPDQRLYRVEGLPADEQPVKPVTYSVVKSALLGLTRYLATYWSGANIRVNSISPGGVSNGQPEVFLSRLKQLIPMERMANRDEYQGAILFLCSDASSYMTGANLVVDGGRTCW